MVHIILVIFGMEAKFKCHYYKVDALCEALFPQLYVAMGCVGFPTGSPISPPWVPWSVGGDPRERGRFLKGSRLLN